MDDEHSENLARLAEQRLREREEHLRLALEAGQMGTWKWDAVTGLLTADAATAFCLKASSYFRWKVMLKLLPVLGPLYSLGNKKAAKDPPAENRISSELWTSLTSIRKGV